jgi:hypothetical protein
MSSERQEHYISTRNEKKLSTTLDDYVGSQEMALRAGFHRARSVAVRNANNHVFVPSKAHFFAGVQYHFVMLGNVSSSVLLPYKNDVAIQFCGRENGFFSIVFCYRLHQETSP